MAKKRMVATEFNTVNMDENGKPVESLVQADANATVAEKVIAAAEGVTRIPPKAKEKLEEFEQMEKAVSALAKENEALKDRIAGYIEELAELRSRKNETREVIKEVIKEVPVEKIVEKIVEKPVDSKLESELRSLRDENDSYLMKISELTFENAKLTAELTEIKSKQSAPQKTQPKPICVKPRSSMVDSNGYSSWN